MGLNADSPLQVLAQLGRHVVLLDTTKHWQR